MRAITALLTLVLVLAPLPPTATAADANPAVVISEVHPRPVDDVCAEFVEVHAPLGNPGPVRLTGWTLTDNDGEAEITLGHVSLEPGAHLVIWNRRPADPPCPGLDCGKGTPTWNDEGDDVVLLDAAGDLAARLAYGSGAAVDPGPTGGGEPLPRPPRGRSICLDPSTGAYVEAPPSPGVPYLSPEAPPPEDEGGGDGGGIPPGPGPEAAASGSVLVRSVHPGGAPVWEHVVLENPGRVPVDLTGWTLSDGEGTWELPEDGVVMPMARARVALNASTCAILWGAPPDLLATPRGSFCLADGGDDLTLLDPLGTVVDSLWYGTGGHGPPGGWSGGAVPVPRSMPWGRVLARSADEDTDTADDWAWWTEPRCGWMDPPAPAGPFTGQAATFTTPGGGWERMAWAIGSAEESLDVAVYDLASADLASLIAGRARAGVATRVLVEASPVGAAPERLEWRDSLLAALEAAGAQVHVTFPSVQGEAHQPYRYHHEKYVVVDARTVVVTTENLMPSSFPPPGGRVDGGSRGWGAVVRCEPLARALLLAFEHDLRMSAREWGPAEDGTGVDLPAPPPAPSAPPMAPSAELRLLVGPEGWGRGLSALIDVIGGARSSIDLELADLEVRWGDRVSPLVEALLAAAQRGVDVRLLLEPGPEGEGLDRLEELLWLASTRGALRLRGAMASGLPDVTRVHAKGALVDGRTALLGSMNWAQGSVARNREVDLVVASGDAVRELVATFEADWDAAIASAEPRVPARLLMEGLLPMVGPLEGGTVPDLPPRVDGAATEARASAGGPLWLPVARLLVMMAATVAWWWVDRRYGLRRRVSLWVDRRGEAALRLLTRLRGLGDRPDKEEPTEGRPEMVVIVRSSRRPQGSANAWEGPEEDGS